MQEWTDAVGDFSAKVILQAWKPHEEEEVVVMLWNSSLL
jgi:hypothetical protein